MEGYFVEKILVYYRKHGVMTEIRLMKDMVKNLPNDIESIISVVQNIFIHQHWAKRYGIELDDRRKEEPCLRSIEEKLMFLNRSGYSHVMDKRPIENKMIAICRDFTVMAVALCREVVFLQEQDVDLLLILRKINMLIIGYLNTGMKLKKDGY